MSNVLRKMERSIIRDQIRKDRRKSKDCFADAWKSFREKKYIVKDESGNIISDNTPRNTMPKKQRHFDSTEQYNNLFAFMDGLKKENKKNENIVSE